MLTKQQTQ